MFALTWTLRMNIKYVFSKTIHNPSIYVILKLVRDILVNAEHQL